MKLQVISSEECFTPYRQSHKRPSPPKPSVFHRHLQGLWLAILPKADATPPIIPVLSNGYFTHTMHNYLPRPPAGDKGRPSASASSNVALEQLEKWITWR